MELAVPIFKDGKIYNEVEIKKPRNSVISKAHECISKNKIFTAMVEFIAGSIESISSIEGDNIDSFSEIRKLCLKMPYLSADNVAIEIMLLIEDDDAIEGVYECPRCHHKVVTEFDATTDEDTRDHISDLKVFFMKDILEDYKNQIDIELENPISIKNARTNEILDSVESLTLRYPTLEDCILAQRTIKGDNDVTLQLAIYLKALVAVNGEPVNQKWLSVYGDLVFGKMLPTDTKKIGNEIKKYGMEKTSEKFCPKCNKVWRAVLNTSNFFVSGLQQD
jgi:hypothetical protein